ncbi:hypothetical protein FHS43_004714 [Streptosporangium becharense]|uniref:DUF4307 domain-containing protein n=1 Tax=Streptosporangium becharense TaxID=1816182 RepID=A0A7W9II04_9ACTN|nr:DUF4307 domain-containing protein [Streptosporangium becharense]MBB2913410.1 hypothetical protein [Streptosporangium becharense]MBB5821100.1 hypothetical protein [Streptosporangium becharense]
MATSEAGKGRMDGPVLGTPGDFPDRPERRGRLVVHVVIAILCAVCAGGWGYVMWAAKGDTEVIDQVIAFDVKNGDSAQITFEVNKPSDRAALCRLRALDVDHAEVGSKEVNIPAGERYVRLTERLETSAQATSAHVQYCYLV